MTDRALKYLISQMEAIKVACTEGRVCDDVAWFDEFTTLFDHCDLAIEQANLIMEGQGTLTIDHPPQSPLIITACTELLGF